MKVLHGPTGKLIQGHVFDVNVRAFNEALRFYDPLLYTKWNPAKLRGWGCWEIRRRPSKKSSVYKGTHKGVAFYSLEYRDMRDIHHVLDCAFLNYDAIRKLKLMDTWAYKDFCTELERRESDHAEAVRAKAAANAHDAFKDNRAAFRDMIEMMKSGIGPGQIMNSINWASIK